MEVNGDGKLLGFPRKLEGGVHVEKSEIMDRNRILVKLKIYKHFRL